ncbi:MAG TPA: hemerythrin domain-containing protein [Streptosporangiaceae bacterium]|jgi:hypothetical protein
MARSTNGADQPAEPGWALTRLIKIHDGMRDDLALLRRAVQAIAEDDRGMATAMLGSVSFREPGWSLRVYCAHFCRFVQDHHSVEDTMLFPVLLRDQLATNPGFAKVIELLAADHRALTGYLDNVERALRAAPDDENAGAAALGAIERLSDHLETHLAFEEETLAPALNALSAVVSEDDFDVPDDAAVIAEDDDVLMTWDDDAPGR